MRSAIAGWSRKGHPVRIGRRDEPDAPRTRPALDVLLAKNGARHGFVRLGIDEPLQAVAFGEAGHSSSPMLPGAAGQVVRYANIDRTIRPIGHDVEPRLPAEFHARTRGWPSQAWP